MFKQLSLAAAALTIGATAIVPVAPAAAQRYERGYQGYAYDNAYQDGYNREYSDYRNDGRNYRDDGRRYYSDNRNNRYNYRNRNRCSNGDGGTVIGAIAGGLLGNVVAGRGDRLLGTVIGAGGGALAGRAIDKSGNRDYCRR